MFDPAWITTSGSTVLMVVLSAVGIYVALLVLTRLAGLRSFSKMSSFDFAITVAFGTILASTIVTEDPPLVTGAVALAALFGIQYTVSRSRRLSSFAERIVDNEPLVVMADGQVLPDHLDRARMTVEDLRSKLRMAGVTHRSEVLAVVLETTGDVSVLRKSDRVGPWVFDGVRGADRLELTSRDEAPST